MAIAKKAASKKAASKNKLFGTPDKKVNTRTKWESTTGKRMDELKAVITKNGNGLVFILSKGAKHTEGVLSMDSFSTHEVAAAIAQSFPQTVLDILAIELLTEKLSKSLK